ncbi:MAG: TRAP transporter small permease subunit [Deinococcales bacterium]
MPYGSLRLLDKSVEVIMNFFLSLSRGIDTITNAIGKITFWLTTVMVLVGAYNVITRYLSRWIGIQLSGNVYFELQTYAYDLIFLLGAAYVFSQNGHVRVDIIFSNLKEKTRAWIDVFGAMLFLVPFCWLGIFLSRKYVADSWRVFEQSPNPGGLPRYPMKTVIIMAFALLIIQAISETIKNIAFIRGHENSGSVHDPKRGLGGAH